MTLENLPILATLVYLLGIGCYSYGCDQRVAATPAISLTADEEKQLQECFPSSIYYLKNLEYRAHTIHCHGQLRSPNFKYSYDTVSHNLKQAFGDRFLCYLQEGDRHDLGGEDLFENAAELRRYRFYVVEAQQFWALPRSRQSAIAKSLLSAMIAVLFLTSWAIASGTGAWLLPAFSGANVIQSLPYAIAVILVLMTRAIAQYYVTRKYRIAFVPPLYIPWLDNGGILGIWQPSIQNKLTTRLTIKQQRQCLFDLGAFPNLAGIIASILLLILGHWLFLPLGASLNELVIQAGEQPIVPDSALATLIQKLCLAITPDRFAMPSALILAGWTGLIISAVQILPFEFLDGGNLAIAMYNHQQVRHIAQISRLLFLAIALLIQPWLLIYALWLFALPLPRPLVLNEGISIDSVRDYIGLALMAIALAIILPYPSI